MRLHHLLEQAKKKKQNKINNTIVNTLEQVNLTGIFDEQLGFC
jgi:hypothetical protein